MSEDRSDDAVEEAVGSDEKASDGTEDRTDDRWADVDDRWEDADEDEGSEWKFALDDVDADGVVQRRPIEPETIDPESAVFVLLGIAATVALLARMAMLLT